ncbi:zinc finger protein VAR3, chloroplastic-like [Phragmites australis]|uniref:zinc finger protein VAR3, chloroplastic-like n=1 Tax=Phragmites australis TaxID=29695 RepID=UPI002D79AA42|nr:zinc finger protein VAR3, chloroplastic-like [Phragmites australis]
MASSSSKLLTLTLTSSFLRSCRLASTSLLPNSSRRLPGPLLSLRLCSSATAAVDVAADSAAAAVSSGHPWPEWGDFLDKLRAKGYFERAAPACAPSATEGSAGDGEEAVAAEDAVASDDTYPFRDLNRVKNACLKFARERFDLLSFLPKQDIQVIVECGCPNIYRKAVNSAKRLREFVQVEEGDACSVCKLRGSCDKAYVIPKAEEGARTVDVVRILLTYAIEPSSLSGENSVDGGVQESARKLLLELTKLSEKAIDPSLPKPVFQTSSKQESSSKLFAKSKESAAKSRGSVGKGIEMTATEMKKGDWLCPNCNFLNFARNRRCLECKADGPKKIEAATTEMKMGDWICIQCHFMNFSRNKICFKCEEPRPKRQLNPGEWECPSCDFVNFRRNKSCKKCNHDRPEDDTQDNQLGQRNMKGAGKNRSFDYIDQDEDNDDDVLPSKGARKHVGSMKEKLGPRRTAAKSRSVGFVDQEDCLLTAKRSAEEDDDNEGVRKHVVSRRATPDQRRFTAARNL